MEAEKREAETKIELQIALQVMETAQREAEAAAVHDKALVEASENAAKQANEEVEWLRDELKAERERLLVVASGLGDSDEQIRWQKEATALKSELEGLTIAAREWAGQKSALEVRLQEGQRWEEEAKMARAELEDMRQEGREWGVQKARLESMLEQMVVAVDEGMLSPHRELEQSRLEALDLKNALEASQGMARELKAALEVADGVRRESEATAARDRALVEAAEVTAGRAAEEVEWLRQEVKVERQLVTTISAMPVMDGMAAGPEEQSIWQDEARTARAELEAIRETGWQWEAQRVQLEATVEEERAGRKEAEARAARDAALVEAAEKAAEKATGEVEWLRRALEGSLASSGPMVPMGLQSGDMYGDACSPDDLRALRDDMDRTQHEALEAEQAVKEMSQQVAEMKKELHLAGRARQQAENAKQQAEDAKQHAEDAKQHAEGAAVQDKALVQVPELTVHASLLTCTP